MKNIVLLVLVLMLTACEPSIPNNVILTAKYYCSKQSTDTVKVEVESIARAFAQGIWIQCNNGKGIFYENYIQKLGLEKIKEEK